MIAGTVLALVSSLAPTTGQAADDGPAVPRKVVRWFANDPDAQSSLHDKADLSQLAGTNPEVAKALGSGVKAEFGTIAPEFSLTRPEMDLNTGKLSEEPLELSKALAPRHRYCAMIRVGDLFTDAELCAQVQGDGSVSFADASYSCGFLDSTTQLPRAGYVVTLSGMFTFDVTAQTLTAMDAGALYSVPQGTVSATDLITALARDDAEHVLINKTHPDAGGGTSPLFFATGEEKAKHDAEIAELLAEADGTSTQAAASQSAPPAANDPTTKVPIAAAASEDGSSSGGAHDRRSCHPGRRAGRRRGRHTPPSPARKAADGTTTDCRVAAPRSSHPDNTVQRFPC